MGRIYFLLTFIFIFFAAGCKTVPQRSAENDLKNGKYADIAGVWEAEGKVAWGFKVEPDGSITKIIHSLGGQMVVSEGAVSLEGPEPDTYAFFVLGPYEIQYDKRSQKLDLRIKLDQYYMKLPAGELLGRTEDYFTGIVSQDRKTWPAEWRSYNWLEGATEPDVNEINANPEKLVFRKVDMEKASKEHRQKHKNQQKQ
jgi:hypothetical protein